MWKDYSECSISNVEWDDLVLRRHSCGKNNPNDDICAKSDYMTLYKYSGLRRQSWLNDSLLGYYTEYDNTYFPTFRSKVTRLRSERCCSDWEEKVCRLYWEFARTDANLTYEKRKWDIIWPNQCELNFQFRTGPRTRTIPSSIFEAVIDHSLCKFLHNRRIAYFSIHPNVNQSLGERGSTIPEMSKKTN
jgi:hypothetical protein